MVYSDHNAAGGYLMSKIKEVLYYSTLRCNCRCKHCDIRSFYSASEEMSCLDVLSAINSSEQTRESMISITGGEPFLRKDIGDFIVKAVDDSRFPHNTAITTNGFYTDRILETALRVKHKERLVFSISIDGLETVHEEIRRLSGIYQRALKSVSILSEAGIRVEVNTVIQPDNAGTILTLKQLVESIGGNVKFTPQPMVTSIAQESGFCYTDRYISEIMPYLRTQNDIFYTVSRGTALIKNCHAGTQNIVIDPVGKVFPCAFAVGYNDVSRNDYILGDITKSSISDILSSRQYRSTIDEAVSKCSGCNMPCDAVRERSMYNVPLEYTGNMLSRHFSSAYASEPLYDFSWDSPESDGNGIFRWMCRNECRVFLSRAQLRKGSVKLRYQNVLSPENSSGMKLRASLLGTETELPLTSGMNEAVLKFEPSDKEYACLTLKLNKLWSPAELFGNSDTRQLGIQCYEIT